MTRTSSHIRDITRLLACRYYEKELAERRRTNGSGKTSLLQKF